MKFCLISDTHFGYDENTEQILENFYKELNELDFDILLHAGDWVTIGHTKVYKALNQIRSIIDRPILSVLGNHDIWDDQNSDFYYEEIYNHILSWFKIFNIVYIPDNPQIFDNILIGGFDGWYCEKQIKTKDKYKLPKKKQEKFLDTYDFLMNKVHKDLEKFLLLNSEGKKVICLTHFHLLDIGIFLNYWGGNQTYFNFISEKCDILCVGHDHLKYDFVKNDCRVIDAGGNYNKPSYTIFELN